MVWRSAGNTKDETKAIDKVHEIKDNDGIEKGAVFKVM